MIEPKRICPAPEDTVVNQLESALSRRNGNIPAGAQACRRPEPRAQFIVRMKDGFALHFLTNACCQAYAIVADDEATCFPDRLTADITARNYNLHGDQFEICELTD
ncbi:MAG: hypothetical protein JWQ71_4469 [Pedosphaera sp.]|nr:hypothetical protein [Pedosphaera sp.]